LTDEPERLAKKQLATNRLLAARHTSEI
jgi:hypothetical protein